MALVLAAAPLVRHIFSRDGIGQESHGTVDPGKGQNSMRPNAE